MQQLIDATNTNVDFIKRDSPQVAASTSARSVVLAEASAVAFREGVTKVEAHWYGFRVWLSRTTVRGIGAGAGIGALWIPEPIVSKVLASIGGGVAAFTPGGVVFNYTPVVTPATPFGAFWGQEWQ